MKVKKKPSPKWTGITYINGIQGVRTAVSHTEEILTHNITLSSIAKKGYMLLTECLLMDLLDISSGWCTVQFISSGCGRSIIQL